MDERERIESDVRQFHENIKQLAKTRNKKYRKILELARQYIADAEYYLKRRDYVTSFGCANYAHGLLDALRLQRSISR